MAERIYKILDKQFCQKESRYKTQMFYKGDGRKGIGIDNVVMKLLRTNNKSSELELVLQKPFVYLEL